MKNSQETKKSLSSALKKLMRSKEMDKISIREITSLAGVNRQTFYYHFEDIYDLLRWTIQQEAITLIDIHQNAKEWQDGFRQLLYYLEQNKQFCLCALKSVGHEHMKRFFYSDLHNIVQKIVYNFGKKYETNEENIEYLTFLTHFFTISLGTLVASWLNDEMDYTPEQLIEMIDLFVKDHSKGFEMRLKESKDN